MTCPFSSILLATEGTEFDTGAERVGIGLAAKCGVPMMAVMPLVTNAEYQIVAPERAAHAEAHAAAKIDKLETAAQAQGVELRGRVRLGQEPFREIVDEAGERGADLIVLRRRGKRSYLANLFLGEMVHTVVGHTHCDVLTVPRGSALWSRGILVATDGSSQSARATKMAAALAVSSGLPLTVVSVAEHHNGSGVSESAAQANVDGALSVVRAAGAQATGRVVVEGKPYQAILATADQVEADLIVIGRRGIGRVERMLVGSTSEQVAGSAPGPVLIVHQEVPRAD
jgi:nucleotide-binding universal stress UspA family protein